MRALFSNHYFGTGVAVPGLFPFPEGLAIIMIVVRIWGKMPAFNTIQRLLFI